MNTSSLIFGLCASLLSLTQSLLQKVQLVHQSYEPNYDVATSLRGGGFGRMAFPQRRQLLGFLHTGPQALRPDGQLFAADTGGLTDGVSNSSCTRNYGGFTHAPDAEGAFRRGIFYNHAFDVQTVIGSGDHIIEEV